MPSKVFHAIIGHTKAQQVLCRMAETDQLPHAFLFIGAHHIGKTLMATQLIKYLFPNVPSLEANPDFMELSCLEDEKTGKKKTNISVEQVREMCERMSMSSMNGGWKVVFIRDANALSTGAANAFLKTLEEPKGKTLFILRAPSLESVPATIASRCQILRFHAVPRDTLTDALVKKGFARPDALAAAAFSLGRPGRALRYLTKSEEQAQVDIGITQALDLFSAPLPKQIRIAAELLPKEDVNKRLVADQTLKTWQGVLRDVLLDSIGCSELMTHSDQQTKIQAMSKQLSRDHLATLLHRASEGRTALHHNTNPLLVLEHILFTIHT